MLGRTPRFIVLLACLAGGCGAPSDNEAVFAGGGGKPDPNVPQNSAEADLKYQSSPVPTPKKAR